MNASSEKLQQATFIQDPISPLSQLIKSPVIEKRLHTAFAKFILNPSKLWHSFPWGSSILTTSGKFAQYEDKSPICPRLKPLNEVPGYSSDFNATEILGKLRNIRNILSQLLPQRTPARKPTSQPFQTSDDLLTLQFHSNKSLI